MRIGCAKDSLNVFLLCILNREGEKATGVGTNLCNQRHAQTEDFQVSQIALLVQMFGIARGGLTGQMIYFIRFNDLSRSSSMK